MSTTIIAHQPVSFLALGTIVRFATGAERASFGSNRVLAPVVYACESANRGSAFGVTTSDLPAADGYWSGIYRVSIGPTADVKWLTTGTRPTYGDWLVISTTDGVATPGSRSSAIGLAIDEASLSTGLVRILLAVPTIA